MKKYQKFVNENVKEPMDFNYIMEYVFKELNTDEIVKLKNEIENNINIEESLNENLFSNIKNKLNRWFDDKMMSILINKKKNFYVNLVGQLQKYDLTTLDDVNKAYPRFSELVSIYLAGGMDKAADVGKGWREIVEYIFEIENPGKKRNLENISISYKNETYEVSPSYVINDYHLTEALEKGKSYIKKNYDSPAIFNPVRKEIDRTKNVEFSKAMKKFKSGEYNEDDDFSEISKTFSETIEPEDEKIVVITDAIFFGVNEYTSAGTFGELQQSSFQRIPIFAWFEEGWDIHGHSPWTIPHISKIMRSEDDVRKFVKTMINF